MVRSSGPSGRRQLPLSEFFLGPRKTMLKPDELLAEIIIPKAEPGEAHAFSEVRPAQGTGACAGERGGQHLGGLGQERFRRAANRAGRGGAESDPRDASRGLSSRAARSRRKPWRRPAAMAVDRREADQRLSRFRRVPAGLGRGAHQARAGRRLRTGANEEATRRRCGNGERNLKVNGEIRSASVPPETTLLQLLREQFQSDRGEAGLRRGRLRRVHGDCRRLAGKLLPDAGGPGGWPRRA